jgi:hypothetical protein
VEVYTNGMIPGLLPYILSCVIMKVLPASCSLARPTPHPSPLHAHHDQQGGMR